MPNSDGSWVRDWRARNGYSQDDLANELNVSRQTIIGWEKSDSVSRILELALLSLEHVPNTQKYLGREARRRVK